MAKFSSLPLILIASFYLGCSSSSHTTRFISSDATLTLPVVYNTDAVTNKDAWKHVKKDDVPAVAIRNMEVEVPSQAYQMPYPEVFLQDENVVLCVEDCTKPQPFYPEKVNGSYLLKFKEGKHHKKQIKEDNQKLLHLTTVYYWINRLFAEMKNVGLLPDKRIEVYIDRNLASMTNNAFYSPGTDTITFLPAKRTLFYRLMTGYKFKPTAADPAVIMHELSHYLFRSALGTRDLPNRPVASGLNEGFADYLALSVLDDEEMGIIFSGGKEGGIRDYRENSKLGQAVEAKIKSGEREKTQIEGLEEHDIGEKIAYILIRTKKEMMRLGLTKLEADQVFVRSVVKTFETPFATITDFVKNYVASVQLEPRLKNLDIDVMKGFRAIGAGTEFPKANFAEVKNVAEKKGDKYIQVAVNTIYSDEYKAQGAKDEFVKVGFMDVINSPSSASATWFRLNHERGNEATPFWAYYDQSSSQILDVFYNDGAPLSQSTPEDLERFNTAFAHFPDMIGFLNPNQSSDLKEVLGSGTKMLGMRLYKVKKTTTVNMGVRIKNELYDAYTETYEISPKLLTKVLGGTPKYEVKLVWAPNIKNSYLVKNAKGDALVGYIIEYPAIAKMQFMLTDANLK